MKRKFAGDSAGVRPSVAYGTGLLALDVVLHVGDEAPSQVRVAGGTCGNVLAILRYMGWSAAPVARLKNDLPYERIREDLARWSLKLDHVYAAPDGSTPVYVQTIRRNPGRDPVHTFSARCPACGGRLPSYKPLTAAAAEEVASAITAADVFFFDRASRGSILLAQRCAELGALVMFEPSGVGDESLFKQAAEVSHILKYSHERLSSEAVIQECGPVLQIETLGREGLRYRSCKRSGKVGAWRQMGALAAPAVRDTSGSGDWCSAGVLHALGKSGLTGLLGANSNDVENALLLGQALGAWNCGFEGARGGMYEVSPEAFREQVSAILDHRHLESASAALPHAADSPVSSFCSLCATR